VVKRLIELKDRYKAVLLSGNHDFGTFHIVLHVLKLKKKKKKINSLYMFTLLWHIMITEINQYLCIFVCSQFNLSNNNRKVLASKESKSCALRTFSREGQP
jgi:L-cystine uptake protein TcyP (sodium:dicarboxylate symporter family)